jgi:hypothetical protein
MGLGGVAALAGDDVPDAAPWVGYVAAVARDEVDVQVEDGLACGFADVDADVEAVGVVAAGEELSALVDGGCYGGSLLCRGVEPGRDVPPRDDQQVAFAHGEGIPEGPREPVFEGDPFLGGEAEGAGRGRRHRLGSDLAARRVISSLPSRPAATQAAQRQALTGRRPTRLDWQTGHQWSYKVCGAALGLGWCFRRGLPAASL